MTRPTHKHMLFYSLALLYLVASLAFVSHVENKQLCNAVELEMHASQTHFFIDKGDVAELIRQYGGSVVGSTVASVSVRDIERGLEQHSSIKNAEVYWGANYVLHARVQQRTPIVRVIDHEGESYYIDEQGFVMSISQKYTARVPIVSGHVAVAWDSIAGQHLSTLKDSEAQGAAFMHQLYEFASFVHQHAFWQKQIQQIHITPTHEVELIPRVGAHIILLGSFDDYTLKLKKLESLYHQALNKIGWNQYRIINLKYKNQVVCTKR